MRGKKAILLNTFCLCSLDREAAEDLELGGYRVEKGMRILVPAWAIHMDPQYWPEPDKFDPERSVGRGGRSPGDDKLDGHVTGLGHQYGPSPTRYGPDPDKFDPERSV